MADAEPDPTGPSEEKPGRDLTVAVIGFLAGAILITVCAFTLPKLPAAVAAIGPWPVWGGFTIITVVAGILFWSNVQKIYGLLR